MNARIHIESVLIECPHCGEPIASGSGSQFWTVDELAVADRSMPCCGCRRDVNVRIPKRVPLCVGKDTR